MTVRTSAEPAASQADNTSREPPFHEVSQKVSILLEPPPLRGYAGSIFLVVLGVAALGFAAARLVMLDAFTPGLAATGLALCAVGGSLLWLRSRSQGNLVLERDALVFVRGKAHHVLPYASLAFAVRVRPDRSLQGMWRTLVMKTPEVRLRVSNFTPAGAHQPFAAFLEQLAERVAATVQPRLAVEGLQGKGWKLDGKNLHHGEQTTPLSSIVALGWFWKRIVLWRHEESMPLLLIDSESFNAHALTVLLARHLPGWEERGGGIVRANWNALPSDFEPQAVLHGDGTGEHFRMERGKYSAGLYVAMAFVLQATLVGGLCTFVLEWSANAFLPGALASQLLLPVALIGPTVAWFTFRDRWGVIEAFSSRYCSGLMNFSMLYVPIVAWVYANVRGLRKLTGT